MSSAPINTGDDRYEVLLATISCAAARLDPQLNLIDFNHQAEVLFGLRGEDVIGRPFAELAKLSSNATALVRELERALAGDDLSWTECDVCVQDGSEVVLVWTARRLHVGDRTTGLMLIGQDLTDRRKAERRVRSLELEADRQRRLAEVGAIVARVTHDLSNPLTVATLLISRLQDLAEHHPAAPIGSVGDELADLDASLQDLQDLVDGCRNFLRDQRLELTELSVADLLRDVLRTWSHDAAHRGIQLRTQIAPGVPRFHGDASKLRRVLDNLVRNALEAIDHGPGTVTIAVAASDDRDLEIEVRDTGPGLPEGIDVFAAFATTKRHGTGLGLAIARQFVEAHGGRIAAEALPALGTLFRIVLPRRPPGLAERQLAAPMAM